MQECYLFTSRCCKIRGKIYTWILYKSRNETYLNHYMFISCSLAILVILSFYRLYPML